MVEASRATAESDDNKDDNKKLQQGLQGAGDGAFCVADMSRYTAGPMSVMISMLRGVNLGPHNRIKMDDLKAVYESVKLQKPRTYVQSGNVLFKTIERNEAKLSSRIQDAIEKKFGFRPDVILRTTEELRATITKNPFAARKNIDPSKFLVTFLSAEPSAEAREKLLAIDTAPEELRLVGREIFIYYTNGLARPKFQWTKAEKILKVSCTGRNWNSVTKMLEMAEEMERE